ncbi:prf interactor 30137, partial [Genlisea aurea]
VMGGVSFLRPFLQNLCFNSPWNYAVFWKLRAPQHENVLAWEDGFCNIQKLKIPEDIKIEDFYSTEILHSDFSPYLLSKNPCNYTVGLAVAEMSRTSHVMGNGVVGEVALTRKPRWIYAAQIAADTSKTIISQYPDEWLLQIAAGIKTILLFPVVPHGVLQLGSIEMVAEDATILSCVENVLACCDDSGLPDWRYLIRELPLM